MAKKEEKEGQPAKVSADSFEEKQARAEKKSRRLAFLWLIPVIVLFAVYGIIRSRWTLRENGDYVLFIEKVIPRKDADSFEAILQKRLAAHKSSDKGIPAHSGALSAVSEKNKKPVLFLIGYNQYNINFEDSLLNSYFKVQGRNQDFAFAATAAKHPFPYEFIFRVNILKNENIIFIKGNDPSLYSDYIEYTLLAYQIERNMRTSLRTEIDAEHANAFPVIRQAALGYYLWEKNGGGSPGGRDGSYRAFLDKRYSKDSKFWSDIDIYYGYSGDEIADMMSTDYAFADYIVKLTPAGRSLYYSRLLNGGFLSWKELAPWEK